MQLKLDYLKNKKSLLAFSHGVDSTALFYLLNSAGVSFDCAMVNYQTRPSSLAEEISARELCKKFNKKIFIHKANLNLSNSNFEKIARDIRYEFFDKIMCEYDYDALILAHQLNDALEWLLMQLSKGSGAVGLAGMMPRSKKRIKFQNITKNIEIFRPLLGVSKDEILKYLQSQNIEYFVDLSNQDIKFKRNRIRAEFSDKFISQFASGVKRSFELLRGDAIILLGEFEYEDGELFIVKKLPNSINLIDQACKKLGVLMSQKTRELCTQNDCVVSHKVTITSNQSYYFIAPYIKTKMDKNIKDKFRILKIPALLRPYLSLNSHKLNALDKFLS
ncbi:tRNA lysidine(34) synthetase TilS [Campylobacter sp. CX2-4080-23]|uniref:tRNA lysidine(34) synthetase TilS n=1 Tax=Campylobacter porcelli TaxID=1660073 RepID=UPI002EBDC249|nr:tRNA lysidine(34) synthetase TilS [Campylobacter sp. CX2-4080-23]